MAAYDPQWVSDYLQIRDLSARYNYYADMGDAENYAALFTEDGEFDVDGQHVFRGHQQLADVMTVPRQNRATRSVHITTDPTIEIDGDIAHQRSRVISYLRMPDGSRNEFVATGWFHDELRRTPDGWRFTRRRSELDLNIDQALAKLGVGDGLARVPVS